jgi:hydroxyacylglutathione hydrolase
MTMKGSEMKTGLLAMSAGLAVLLAGLSHARPVPRDAIPFSDARASGPGSESASGLFPHPWISGTAASDPTVQVQKLAAGTFVIRQSLATNFEAPFLYLLLGNRQALLLDTGAGGLTIRPAIDRLIEQWCAERGLKRLHLIVAHSHGHRDHIAGDAEFRDRPDTVIVGHAPEAVATFFGIRRWPDSIAQLDLGGRVVSIIPTPGHQNAHIAIYDPQTRSLLTGDMLYPGRVFVPANRTEEMRRSVDRALRFAERHRVRHILGAHVEMDRKGIPYPDRATVHPDEPPLDLPLSALAEMRQGLKQDLGEPFTLNPQTGFIIFPVLARPD